MLFSDCSAWRQGDVQSKAAFISRRRLSHVGAHVKGVIWLGVPEESACFRRRMAQEENRTKVLYIQTEPYPKQPVNRYPMNILIMDPRSDRISYFVLANTTLLYVLADVSFRGPIAAVSSRGSGAKSILNLGCSGTPNFSLAASDKRRNLHHRRTRNTTSRAGLMLLYSHTRCLVWRVSSASFLLTSLLR